MCLSCYTPPPPPSLLCASDVKISIYLITATVSERESECFLVRVHSLCDYCTLWLITLGQPFTLYCSGARTRIKQGSDSEMGKNILLLEHKSRHGKNSSTHIIIHICIAVYAMRMRDEHVDISREQQLPDSYCTVRTKHHDLFVFGSHVGD